MGRLNRRMAETAHSSTLLVSRDTRCLSYIPAVAAPCKGAHIEAEEGLIYAVADKQSWRTPKGQRLESHTNARLCRLLPKGRKNPFFSGRALRSSQQPQPLLHKKGLRPIPQTPMPSPGQGLNRSSCRSYIKVSSDHQRSGVISLGYRTEKAQDVLR